MYNACMINEGEIAMKCQIELDFVDMTRNEVFDEIAIYKGTVIEYPDHGETAVVAFESLEQLRVYLGYYYNNDEAEIAEEMKRLTLIPT